MLPATHVDLYQLTSLVPHWDAGLADVPVTMSFFSRRLPRHLDKSPARGYLLWVGLRRCLEWLESARFTEEHLETLRAHPTLGPALRARSDLAKALRGWRFSGRIRAPKEGTPLWAGAAVKPDGERVNVDGVRPSAQTPYLVVETDLLAAKLIETPLLSIINHMTMVGSKAAKVVEVAGERAVLEFGTRRTHPKSAVDAAYAAYVAGCAGTSNVEAHHRYGIPVLGTMDHFAIQAWERPGVPRHETERAYFKAFWSAYPDGAILLVDTYDTYGERTGIRNAVMATDGQLKGVRLDSAISVENVKKARAMLDALGAPTATIVVSGGMDEHAIRELESAPVDAFGVGERIVTSPDAPVGVGAVGKLCEIGGRPTMKLSRGSGKATLPGKVQVFRHEGVDTVALLGEELPGQPLLEVVWDEHGPRPLPALDEVRAYAMASVAALSEEARTPRQVEVPVTAALAELIEQIVRGDGLVEAPQRAEAEAFGGAGGTSVDQDRSASEAADVAEGSVDEELVSREGGGDSVDGSSDSFDGSGGSFDGPGDSIDEPGDSVGGDSGSFDGDPVDRAGEGLEGHGDAFDADSESLDDGGDALDGEGDPLSVDAPSDSVDGSSASLDGSSDSLDDGGEALDDGGEALDDGGEALDDGGEALDDGGDALDGEGDPLSVDGPADSVDGSSDSVDGGGDALDGSSDSLDGSSDSLDGSSDSLDGSSDSLDGSSDSLDGSSDALDGSSDSLDGSSDSLDGSSDSLDGSSDSLDGRGNVLDADSDPAPTDEAEPPGAHVDDPDLPELPSEDEIYDMPTPVPGAVDPPTAFGEAPITQHDVSLQGEFGGGDLPATAAVDLRELDASAGLTETVTTFDAAAVRRSIASGKETVDAPEEDPHAELEWRDPEPADDE